MLENEDQARDYYRTRCAALNAVANEFFYNYQGSSSLILQKTRETHPLPDFVEYVYCWFARDQLCGAILSGVTSDAGTHAQVNDQESVFCEHSAEVAQALSSRVPRSPRPGRQLLQQGGTLRADHRVHSRFENLVYLSRILADQIGRPLNTERCALERTQAQAEIDQWKDALRRADEARKTRILRLAELL